VPERHDNLFERIANFAALHAAWRKAVSGKRHKPGAAAFTANLEKELLRLERALQDGSWQPGRYVEIAVREPKPRMVSAAPFRDRVVHHALCAVVDRPRRARKYRASAPCDLPRWMVRSRVACAVRPDAGEAWPLPVRRVLRGGPWDNNPRNVRAGYRNDNDTGNRNNNGGFRVPGTLPARAGRITIPPAAAER